MNNFEGVERMVESPCPITGLYTGEITDLVGMCAELSSNCDTREIMYFKVSDCVSGELYEGMHKIIEKCKKKKREKISFKIKEDNKI